MDSLSDLTFLLPNMLPLVPSLLVLATTVYLLVRRSTPESILMSIGAFIEFLTMIFYTVVLPLMSNAGAYQDYQRYLSIASAVGMIGALMFAVGLFMLVHKAVNAGQ